MNSLVVFENESIRSHAIELWYEAFGDNKEYINFFLNTHDGCRCEALIKNGRLVSALYLIDGSLNGIEGSYLFAAATFKEFRGMGFMAELLGQAAESARLLGKSFIALVPAEKSLFEYYDRFGYKTAFYAKEHTDFSCVPSAETGFEWCPEHYEYILEEQKRYSTQLVFSGKEIFSVFGTDSRQFIKVPAPKREGFEYGMLLPLEKKAEYLTGLNSYIGLTLE